MSDIECTNCGIVIPMNIRGQAFRRKKLLGCCSEECYERYIMNLARNGRLDDDVMTDHEGNYVTQHDGSMLRCISCPGMLDIEADESNGYRDYYCTDCGSGFRVDNISCRICGTKYNPCRCLIEDNRECDICGEMLTLRFICKKNVIK